MGAGQPRWSELLFWSFSYVWLGVAGLAQVLSVRNPLFTSFSQDQQLTASGVLLVGFVAFDIGIYFGFSRFRADRKPLRPMAISETRVKILAVLTLLFTPLLVSLLGGLGTLFSSREALTNSLSQSNLYSSGDTSAGGTLLAVAGVMPAVSLLAILWIWKVKPTSRNRIDFIALFAGLVVVNLILNNPISTPRFWILTILLAIVLSWTSLWSSRGLAGLVVAFVVVGLIAFPYLDAFRYDQVGGAAATVGIGARPVDFYLGKTDYGSFTDVGATVRYVDRHGTLEGKQLSGAALFWLPRSVWESKPNNTAYILAVDSNFPNLNLDSPLWAEGFVDFGWFGTWFLLLAFALLVRRADLTFVQWQHAGHSGYVPSGLLFSLIFAAYESFLLRGSLLQAMSRICLVALVVLLLSTRVEGSPE
ncbi:hypothetical protein [Actinomycetospora chiangmaiensis]|uniref:hypothetical protein n=1 Tax=Actinomycetospora chiangmaiensis TaxID=402650 RepID=UPI0012F8F680|nr:hypothetical protein [Actinomycetospora chiangmaiensis]